ncbi:MAG TPA: hypothetical protein VG105_05450 [Paraburkholderia sp.]|jgi:hypothetical protein|nr:hypothetical protein [Paraburkholderia sp.]
MTMSPFCLINVAAIRDHATISPEIRENTWHKHLTGWMARLLLPVATVSEKAALE